MQAFLFAAVGAAFGCLIVSKQPTHVRCGASSRSLMQSLGSLGHTSQSLLPSSLPPLSFLSLAPSPSLSRALSLYLLCQALAHTG
jgi:hypothetical protein